MTRLALLAAVLGLSGCLFNDCSFDTETLDGSGVLQAEVGAVGDTLTLAFVDAGDPGFDVYVRAGLEANPAPTEDGTVRLGFGSEAFVYQGARPPQFELAAVGDTVYVYVSGSLDPSVFRRVCSPPLERVRLDVTFAAAPPAVRAIRTVRLGAEDVAPAAAGALRQRDAHRTTTV